MSGNVYGRAACLVASVLVAALVSCRTAAPPAAPVPSTADKYLVVLYEYKFQPTRLVVPVGTTVTWLNRDLETHNVTGIAASDPFDSGRLSHQETFSHTFTIAGEFLYLCVPHPGMQGTIVVE